MYQIQKETFRDQNEKVKSNSDSNKTNGHWKNVKWDPLTDAENKIMVLVILAEMKIIINI